MYMVGAVDDDSITQPKLLKELVRAWPAYLPACMHAWPTYVPACLPTCLRAWPAYLPTLATSCLPACLERERERERERARERDAYTHTHTHTHTCMHVRSLIVKTGSAVRMCDVLAAHDQGSNFLLWISVLYPTIRLVCCTQQLGKCVVPSN